MAVLRLVLGDQLSDRLTALEGLDPAADTVLMAEVRDEATYVRHHKQKIALVFAAMRNHAERLRARGVRVRYVAIDDPDNSGSITGELARALAAGAAQSRPDDARGAAQGEHRRRGPDVGAPPASGSAGSPPHPDGHFRRRAGG